MGKSSRRSRQTAAPKSDVGRDVATAGADDVASSGGMSAAPPQFILLDMLGGGDDEKGQSLVRDCSCRGESGFGHLSCIAKYAERKYQDSDQDDNQDSLETWETCPNCNQYYQHELRLDLADALLAFLESFPNHPVYGNFSCCPLRYMEGMYLKLYALSEQQVGTYLDDIWKVALELMSLIEKLRACPPWVFGPAVLERFTELEALIYNQYGMTTVKKHKTVLENEGAQAAIKYFEHYRDLSRKVGDSEGITDAGIKVSQCQLAFNGSSLGSSISFLQDQYKQTPSHENGLSLHVALSSERHSIEDERLLAELLVSSRQIHGVEHEQTTFLLKTLKKRRARQVCLKSRALAVEFYQAIRYEEGNKCLVQGPIATSRDVDKEKTFIVGTDDLILTPGTPVLCHGLKNASHLNGKIGDARMFDPLKERYPVHFEDANLKPCLIKLENIRIIFDLPEK
eukprot:CAMPEP_0172319320 /NCGR_PEP_ID=MMETSP1058-20130122/37344_1 /TAXON_ID=83371 /ORGANISM="Detonula confervacea, Strain CCMP 353" /LENGTH=454 /DNA_ID=CAMNT_0013034333 /DNA_START=28 /DNA_END=1393 /DNA_ORIENTATION=+